MQVTESPKLNGHEHLNNSLSSSSKSPEKSRDKKKKKKASKAISLSDDGESNGNSEVQIISAISNSQKSVQQVKGTTPTNKSDVIMIDLDSEGNNTQSNKQSGGSSSPQKYDIDEDEWMSDDNLDAKIEILRKQIQAKNQQNQGSSSPKKQ